MTKIGDNNPPADPFELARDKIDTLYEEAGLWLDGSAVTTQGQADGLGNLLNMIRAAEKEADEARKIEKAPHMEAAKAVDTKWKLLTEQAKRAADACKQALAPWLEKLEAEQRAKAEAARREAEEKARAAREAYQAANVTNLAERERAEVAIKQAQAAERAAKRAEKDTAKAGGDWGRAIGLRNVVEIEVTDARELLRYAYTAHHAELLELATKLAERDARAGVTSIPGVMILQKKVAV